MKKNILLLYILFLPLFLIAQGFNKSYTNEASDYHGLGFQGGLLDNDTLVLVGGITKIVIDSFGDSDFVQGFYFTKIDSFGNTLLTNAYFDVPGKEYYFNEKLHIAKLSDKGYLSFGNRNGHEYLIKYKHNGEIEYINDAIGKDSTMGLFLNTVVSFGDGALISGEEWILGTSNNKPFLIKTDVKGNIVWKKTLDNYGLSNCRYFFGLQKLNENALLVGLGTCKNQHWVGEIDTLGNLKKFYISGLNKKEWQMKTLLSTEDGGFLYAGQSLVEVTASGSVINQAMLVKVDKDFKEEWRKIIGYAFYDGPSFYGLTKIKKNQYVAVGVNDSPFVGAYKSTEKGWLYSFNLQGDSLWSRLDTALYQDSYGHAHYYKDVLQLSSGNLIALGHADAYRSDNKDYGWLVKFSPNGCIAPDDCALLDQAELLPTQSLLSCYPNPAGAEGVTIAWQLERTSVGTCRLQLHDVSGRLLWQQTTTNEQGQLLIDTRQLSNGIYYCTLQKQGQVVATQKVVIIK
jgi:hypothetical protein